MNGKFRIYALIVSIVCSSMSWGKMFAGSTNQGSGGRGSSWSSNYGGSSWGGGGGGHK